MCKLLSVKSIFAVSAITLVGAVLVGCPKNAPTSSTTSSQSTVGGGASAASFTFPDGWPILDLTPPAGSRQAQIPAGMPGSGSLTGITDFETFKSYSIAFEYEGNWNTLKEHVLDCLSEYSVKIEEENPGRNLNLTYNGVDHLLVHHSRTKDGTYTFILDGP